jgi:hypothetical protein
LFIELFHKATLTAEMNKKTELKGMYEEMVMAQSKAESQHSLGQQRKTTEASTTTWF